MVDLLKENRESRHFLVMRLRSRSMSLARIYKKKISLAITSCYFFIKELKIAKDCKVKEAKDTSFSTVFIFLSRSRLGLPRIEMIFFEIFVKFYFSLFEFHRRLMLLSSEVFFFFLEKDRPLHTKSYHRHFFVEFTTHNNYKWSLRCTKMYIYRTHGPLVLGSFFNFPLVLNGQ